MFIGRERELTALKEWYDKDGIGMMVIYGRRRIGKSTLIHGICQKEKEPYFIRRPKLEKTEIWNIFKTGCRFADAGAGRGPVSCDRGGF